MREERAAKGVARVNVGDLRVLADRLKASSVQRSQRGTHACSHGSDARSWASPKIVWIAFMSTFTWKGFVT